MHVLTRMEEIVYFEGARRFPALYDLGRLMLNQGCRPDEILELQTFDINLEECRLTIRKGKSRAARRSLRLNAESREICARRLREATSQWLFAGKVPGTRLAKVNGQHDDVLNGLAKCMCGHIRQQQVRGKCTCGCVAFEEVSRLAFVIYDFRHTFATRAAEAGMPIATLAAILGHSDLRSVMKYVHIRQEALDREMERFAALNSSAATFRPVDAAENRDLQGSRGNQREDLSDRKIN
jgi:integrase